MAKQESQVKRFRTGYTSPGISHVEISDRNAAYRKYKENASRQKYYDAIRESAYSAKQKQETLTREKMIPGTISMLTNEAYQKYPEIIFREYFTNLVRESLVWDSEAIEEFGNGIRYMSHKYIAEAIGGLEGLKKAAETNNSEYLRKVYNVCMETGKALAKKKKVKLEKTINSENVDKAKLDFSIDSKDEELIDKNLNELNIEDISSLVKDKVLQVVKDENESQKKDDDFVNDLKEDIQASAATEEIPQDQEKLMTVNNGDAPATSSTETAGDSNESKKKESEDDKEENTDKEKSTKEGFDAYSLHKRVDVQRSLFRSMTARSYSHVLKEGVAAIAGSLNDKNSKHEKSCQHSHRVPPNEVNVYDIYLQGENEDLSYIDFVKNSSPKAFGDNNRIDTDEVLAEAIGMYTILECAYSIKLISPTEKDIKKAIAWNLQN